MHSLSEYSASEYVPGKHCEHEANSLVVKDPSGHRQVDVFLVEAKSGKGHLNTFPVRSTE